MHPQLSYSTCEGAAESTVGGMSEAGQGTASRGQHPGLPRARAGTAYVQLHTCASRARVSRPCCCCCCCRCCCSCTPAMQHLCVGQQRAKRQRGGRVEDGARQLWQRSLAQPDRPTCCYLLSLACSLGAPSCCVPAAAVCALLSASADVQSSSTRASEHARQRAWTKPPLDHAASRCCLGCACQAVSKWAGRRGTRGCLRRPARPGPLTLAARCW